MHPFVLGKIPEVEIRVSREVGQSAYHLFSISCYLWIFTQVARIKYEYYRPKKLVPLPEQSKMETFCGCVVTRVVRQ